MRKRSPTNVRQFARNTNPTMHIKIVHDMIRAIKCEHCKKSFGQVGAKKGHMEMVHSHIRYPCTAPGKAAPTKPTLRPN